MFVAGIGTGDHCAFVYTAEISIPFVTDIGVDHHCALNFSSL